MRQERCEPAQKGQVDTFEQLRNSVKIFRDCRGFTLYWLGTQNNDSRLTEPQTAAEPTDTRRPPVSTTHPKPTEQPISYDALGEFFEQIGKHFDLDPSLVS